MADVVELEENTFRLPNGEKPPRFVVRRRPVGAEVVPGIGVHFRVWAPECAQIFAEWGKDPELSPTAANVTELVAEPEGYFSRLVPDAMPGMFYRFRLESGTFPDPASRFQPQGPHGPSEIIDPAGFAWTDEHWGGVSPQGQVVYELHVGTYTAAGTWAGAMEQLPALAQLGTTIIELMPVADFPGRFGWGYDGVDLYAPTRLYGRPDDFKAFVNRAHELGLGVILDVVYNHLGPDGNYLKNFSKDYFTNRYENEWGEPLNFDGPNSGPVREFFIHNAGYWIEEFHLDGLRLDATQQIFDASPVNVMRAIAEEVRASADGRGTFLVAENEPQHTRLVRPAREGGFSLDALWNDDFHHTAKVALTGRKEAYYTDYDGSPQELISALKHGYLYQGQRYKWQKKRRGTPSFGLRPEQFVNYIQNHDQIANSLRGARIHQLSSPGKFKAMTALLLLAPGTPMLFQGQEFASSSPFHYFADHNPELAKLVAEGRKGFLSQFPSIAAVECQQTMTQPERESTFRACKLNHEERELHGPIYQLHCDLLKLRRTDRVFADASDRRVDGAVLGPQSFVIRFMHPRHGDRLLLVNFGVDLTLPIVPEPLLAPLADCEWAVQWSSEDPCYGGCGIARVETDEGWYLPGNAAVVLAPKIIQGESAA